MSQSQKKKEKTTESNKIKTDIINKGLTDDNVNDKRNKDVQSALVLQGGGALTDLRGRSICSLLFWRKKKLKRRMGEIMMAIFSI